MTGLQITLTWNIIWLALLLILALNGVVSRDDRFPAVVWSILFTAMLADNLHALGASTG